MAHLTLISHDRIAKAMAGPAIRYWELAKALSLNHEVTLITPSATDLRTEEIHLVTASTKKEREEIVVKADLVLTQRITPQLAWWSRRHGTRLILDAYDPEPLEYLEIFREDPPAWRRDRQETICHKTLFGLKMADAVLCANQRQLDLWMGALLALGRLTPRLYDEDPTLRHFIEIIPFGLSSTPPKREGVGPRELFSIPDAHKILLWGGGIWNWFDPLTLLQAMDLLSRRREDIHLVFMGIKHPNEAVPEMHMAKEAIQLAEELNLLGRLVHINYGWIPYEQRQSFLLDADLGVSMHFAHLETHYSFRTRILDYLWAGLPIIATEGDAFADLIRRHSLGTVVPYKDAPALANAIERLVDHPEERALARQQIEKVRPNFFWTTIAQSLHELIQTLVLRPAPHHDTATLRDITQILWKNYHPRRLGLHGWRKVKEWFN